MPSTIPTATELRQQIVADIEGVIGQVVPFLPKAFVLVLATATAGIQILAYRFGQWTLRQIFAATADAEQLARIGDQYGLTPSAAVRAILEADVTGVDATSIPAGTLWGSDSTGVVYSVKTTAIIAAGVATIEIEALTAGDIGNLTAGETLTISSPIAGLDSTATVSATVITGEDAEDTEVFRSDVQQRQANPPQGGAAPDYVQWQREVPGIVKAFAHLLTAGFATCYPMIALTGDRIPDAPKLAEVQAYLADLRRKPLQSTPVATAMTEVVFDITITGLDPDTPELRANIESALAAYLLERFPRQYPDELAPTDVVSTAGLGGVAVGAGMQSGVLTMEADAMPASTRTLAPGELAIIGSMTWLP